MSTALGYVSSAQVGEWMRALTAPGVLTYASLHTADPGPLVDPTGNELPKVGSYTRIKVTWQISGARVLVSKDPVEWRSLKQTVLTHVGLFSGATSGFLRASIPLLTPVFVLSNGTFRLEAGDLYLAWP